MRTIRASEIGSYLFCQRAWWYGKSGIPSENQSEMAAGSEVHTVHGRRVLGMSCLQGLGYLLLLMALVVFVAFLTSNWI
jgi:CRISPR/Cas system-associated exonuclease Cas4 (RecB family)